VRASLSDLLSSGQVLLADGATATNYFVMGLESGEPPEFWTTEHPDRVISLHRQFVDAGADIILTNTFGCNRHRLKLHNAQSRVYELARRAAELARQVADDAERPVVVAGSVGPTGELFEPLGALTDSEAIETFTEQIAGLREGGADVVWIETMSAPEEIRSAAQAAINVGIPYIATMSFDTAGRTMMGLKPDLLESIFEGLSIPPLAIGANCGVGASDVLISVSEMKNFQNLIVSKGNCGIPKFHGTTISYSGTPELMRDYATLAADAGVRIVGGCCGTTPVHVAAMRDGLDHRTPGPPPTLEDVITKIGPLINSIPSDKTSGRKRRRDNN
jgi:5-methyltetrahydrofolate--homocysteine methyltransferase